MKFLIWKNHARTPNGKLLAIILASMFDPQRHTGLICPSHERLLRLTGWSENELTAAIKDLVASGQWEVHSDAQWLVRSFRPTFKDQIESFKHLIKSEVKGSKDVFTWIARYSGLPAHLRLAFIYAVASQKCRWNMLDSVANRWTHGINGTKLFYATLFTHPMMADNSPGNHAYLAELAVVPHDVVPLNYRLRLDYLAEQCGIDAVDLGYELMEHQQHLMHITPLRDGSVELVPTHELHQHLWDLFRRPGGADRNAWELRQGYLAVEEDVPTATSLVDALTHRPPLGFHWIYELTLNGNVLQVGESTQRLSARLEQHLLSPTNSYAHQRTQRLVEAGSIPTIRILALAHNTEVAEVEVGWIKRRVAEGHHLGNRELDVARNATTIRPDSRFDGWPPSRLRAFLEATQRHWEATGDVLTPDDLKLAL